MAYEPTNLDRARGRAGFYGQSLASPPTPLQKACPLDRARPHSPWLKPKSAKSGPASMRSTPIARKSSPANLPAGQKIILPPWPPDRSCRPTPSTGSPTTAAHSLSLHRSHRQTSVHPPPNPANRRPPCQRVRPGRLFAFQTVKLKMNETTSAVHLRALSPIVTTSPALCSADDFSL